MEKFQHSRAVPNIKYNCVVLFFETNILLIYLCFQIFSHSPLLWKVCQNFLISWQNEKFIDVIAGCKSFFWLNSSSKERLREHLIEFIDNRRVTSVKWTNLKTLLLHILSFIIPFFSKIQLHSSPLTLNFWCSNESVSQ